MSWATRNAELLAELVGEHLGLALLPVLLGLAIALPLGWAANRSPGLRAVVVPAAGVLYTIPSLALFVVLPGLLGTARCAACWESSCRWRCRC